jgi:hypothetical protein
MAKMHSESGHTSVSWGGEVFDADEHGEFDVPDEAIPDLVPHGLILSVEQPIVPPSVRPVPQWSNEALKAKAAELELDVEDLDRPALIQAVTAALKSQASQV